MSTFRALFFPLFLTSYSQANGYHSGSAAHGGESLREGLQEFLGGEAPLHELDDLTKVNPVTLETGTGLPLLECTKGVWVMWAFSSALPRPKQAGLLASDRHWAAPDLCLAADALAQVLLQIWGSS